MTRRTPALSMTLTIGILLVLGPTDAGARQMTIENVAPTPHDAQEGVPLSRIASAIKSAGDVLGWKVVGAEPGVIRLRLDVRRHMALVSVGYDAERYWIDYQDSHNLDYHADDLVRRTSKHHKRTIKGPRIHGNYNKWIRNLSRQIQERVRRAQPE